MILEKYCGLYYNMKKGQSYTPDLKNHLYYKQIKCGRSSYVDVSEMRKRIQTNKSRPLLRASPLVSVDEYILRQDERIQPKLVCLKNTIRDATSNLSLLKKLLVDGRYTGQHFVDDIKRISGTEVEVVNRTAATVLILLCAHFHRKLIPI